MIPLSDESRTLLAATLAVSSQALKPSPVEWALCRTDSIGGHLRIVDKTYAGDLDGATANFRRTHREYPKGWVVVSIAALRVMRRFA